MASRLSNAVTMMHIIARPRLHISLADMGFVSLRSFGGVGFSIESPMTVFEFEHYDGVAINGIDQLDEEAKSAVNEIVRRMKHVGDRLAFRAVLKCSAPQHVGLGSKTSLALSLIAGANAFCGAGWSIDEMQLLSGRGGASGVGVHAFFHGGLIWDAGHPMNRKTLLIPSGAGQPMEVPPLMLRLAFPEIWRIVLILPDEPPMSGEDEVRFFAQNAPVPAEEALSTLAALYHGVLPAVKSADYQSLASALREIHTVGFKERELRRCRVQTGQCVRALLDNGIAAGLSSVGPLIYAIVGADDHARMSCVRDTCGQMPTRMVWTVRAWNCGYEVLPGKWS